MNKQPSFSQTSQVFSGEERAALCSIVVDVNDEPSLSNLAKITILIHSTDCSPGGLFFGFMPDSGAIWSLCQKRYTGA
jgi:hypothetical protein